MENVYSYLSLIFIFLMSTIFIFRYSKAKSHLPPSPLVVLPIIGHLHLLSQIPHQAFHKLSLQYGPIIHLFLGSVPCIVASSPETAKEFLKTNENASLNQPKSLALDYITYGSKDFVFANYGPYWKFMKKIVNLQLLNGTTLELLSSIRHDELTRFIRSISENAKVGKSVDLGGELMKLTNNVISRMVTSERCVDKEGEEADSVGKVIADITVAGGSFNLSDYIWLFKTLDLQGFEKRVKDLRSRFDVIIERIMKEREEARKHKEIGGVQDLLDILLDIAQDESMEVNLTRENIKAFIQNVFTAGTDTSASTIEWCLAELVNHPDIMKKAIEEIHQVVGEIRLIQESDVPNLPYLQAIVKETLRLHPTAPLIPRKSTKHCTVAGYDIPVNAHIFINVWALNRDPNHWENQLEFKPERFQENKLDVRGQHFHYLPFGSGKRMCPGISLALHMVHTTLGSMIQCFDWKAGEDGNLTRVDMEEGFGLTLPRAKPLVCIPVPRLDPIPFSMQLTMHRSLWFKQSFGLFGDTGTTFAKLLFETSTR